MKKVVTIHLSNEVFQIEEDGYQLLHQVLVNIQKRRMNEYTEAEKSISDYFRSILQSGKQVITCDNVSEILRMKGYYQYAGNNQNSNDYKRLYRSKNDRVLGGVCSGLGNYWSIDPILVRLLFVLLFFGFGTGLLLYLIMWLVVPKA